MVTLRSARACCISARARVASAGVQFGKDMTKRFLEENGLSLVSLPARAAGPVCLRPIAVPSRLGRSKLLHPPTLAGGAVARGQGGGLRGAARWVLHHGLLGTQLLVRLSLSSGLRISRTVVSERRTKRHTGP